jgi:2-C-methyl-D-erythritol 4-phosphate cytidylyltransferase
MANFSVVLLTAVPLHLGGEGVGAFVKIDGRECLLRSVELFLNRDNIKQILLVVTHEALEESKRKYGAHLGFSGVKLLAGGTRWADQLSAAGEKISEDCSHVLLHDAARPAVAYSDIDALLSEAGKHPGIALAKPVRNGLAALDDAGRPAEFLPPQKHMQIVTPWVIKREMFVEMATSKREASPADVTLLRGSPLNHRVGSPSDAVFVKAMIGMLPKPKMRIADNPFEEAQW